MRAKRMLEYYICQQWDPIEKQIVQETHQWEWHKVCCGETNEISEEHECAGLDMQRLIRVMQFFHGTVLTAPV